MLHHSARADGAGGSIYMHDEVSVEDKLTATPPQNGFRNFR